MSKSYLAWSIPAALLAVLLIVPHILPWPKVPTAGVAPRLAKGEGAPPKDAAVLAGEDLFNHEWQPNDPLAAGGDGLGPVFNARSCVACHNQAGQGGGGGLDHNVTSFLVVGGGPPREGVLHAHGVDCQETLRDVSPDLPPIARPSLDQLASLRKSSRLVVRGRVRLSQRNTPALFGARLIDELPEAVIIKNEEDQRVARGTPSRPHEVPAGRLSRLADGRVGRFGWKAQTASLSDFVRAACANELGLGNPGHPQPRPLGRPDYPERGPDLTTAQCDQITAFVASLPRPVERQPGSEGAIPGGIEGKRLFGALGCADCHQPDLGPVKGLYSDLLLHDMGKELADAGASYGGSPGGRPGGGGPSPGEWRTPPLWGVADSAPYLHDGRAATLEEAIVGHGGQGDRAAKLFQELAPAEQEQLVAFLKTLRAPTPSAWARRSTRSMPVAGGLMDPQRASTFPTVLFGLTVEEARRRAEARGYQFRVLIEDGRSSYATADCRTDRVNVEVAAGKVVRADFG
jgi:CxxC motif-containing protein (DUF1111 family)